MSTDYSTLSSIELLELLKDLDDTEDEVGFNKWELEFVNSMLNILSDVKDINSDNAVLSFKQRKCVIDILEKYS